MKLLEGKKALIFGIANKNSIAWGIAQVLHEHGAELGFSYGFDILELVVNKILSFTEIQNISIYEARKIYFLWRERQ